MDFEDYVTWDYMNWLNDTEEWTVYPGNYTLSRVEYDPLSQNGQVGRFVAGPYHSLGGASSNWNFERVSDRGTFEFTWLMGAGPPSNNGVHFQLTDGGTAFFTLRVHEFDSNRVVSIYGGGLSHGDNMWDRFLWGSAQTAAWVTISGDINFEGGYVTNIRLNNGGQRSADGMVLRYGFTAPVTGMDGFRVDTIPAAHTFFNSDGTADVLVSEIIVEGFSEVPPAVGTVDGGDRVTIEGQTVTAMAGRVVTLTMIDSAVTNIANVTDEQIAHVAQTRVAADGTYEFDFVYRGFTFTGDVVNNRRVFISVDGVDLTPTITRIDVTPGILELDIVVDEAIATLNITAEDDGIAFGEYVLIIAFYDGDSLVGMQPVDVNITGIPFTTTLTENVPGNATRARAFFWRNWGTIEPFAPSPQETL